VAARKAGREDDAHPHNGETWLGRPRYGRNRTSTYRRKERHGRLYAEVKETVGNGKGVREKAPEWERAVCVPTVTCVCMTWANGTEDIHSQLVSAAPVFSLQESHLPSVSSASKKILDLLFQVFFRNISIGGTI